ncbi:MAG: hypothetical protein ACRDTA_27595, partial [Pseudonocardiaceae bacterium]
PAFGLTESVVAAEHFYAAHHAAARFQVCPACPIGLDAALAGRGYRQESPMSLFVADTGRLPNSGSWSRKHSRPGGHGEATVGGVGVVM